MVKLSSFHLIVIVDAPQYAARVFYVLETLLEPSLRMVVMAESMRHPSVTLYSDLVSSLAQEFAIILALISFKIKLCSNDVCRRQVLERRR
jgi:hypothetical protein